MKKVVLSWDNVSWCPYPTATVLHSPIFLIFLIARGIHHGQIGDSQLNVNCSIGEVVKHFQTNGWYVQQHIVVAFVVHTIWRLFCWVVSFSILPSNDRNIFITFLRSDIFSEISDKDSNAHGSLELNIARVNNVQHDYEYKIDDICYSRCYIANYHGTAKVCLAYHTGPYTVD